ncbi:MAG: hypothetical protein ACFFD1_04610 [Candidatus Thorarchaeota archaeon]
MKKSKDQEQKIVIEPIKIATMKVKIVGISPYLSNKMSEDTKQMLLDKQLGRGTEKNKIRDPKKEVEDKIHHLGKNKIGIPVFGIKEALVESAPYIDGLDKKKVKGSLFIIPEDNGVVELKYKKMVVNEATTRDSGRNQTPRTTFRPEFQDWSSEFNIKYNSRQITPDQIINLIKIAGFHMGIGSWRPQCSGSYGMFDLSR